MELRSIEELMDLLYACRHQHALRTAALLRRGRPADKELQVAGLVQGIGQLLCPDDEVLRAWRTAEAVRPLLGRRVHRLVRHHGPTTDDDLQRLRQAAEESRTTVFDAGVLEDWRGVLELVAAHNSRLESVD
ncbi:hypothetical protein OHT57_42050 [Streptomyces sp. NBC_00285]|uniref:hypothetical protein n=1 Tax=Streptomyces sp. NBC_00285 TaxID=2975700 RepID=UPI002E2D7529|nr:hypothetical protein [Streptomyces sp. NBC_00285]